MNDLRAITIEWVKNLTYKGKRHWGLTFGMDAMNRVFIDTEADGTPMEAETFFHEMTHVYMNIHGKKLKKKDEEALAEKVGKAARGLICGTK